MCHCPAYWRTVTLPKGLWCLAYSKFLISAEKQKCWADLCLPPVSPTHPCCLPLRCKVTVGYHEAEGIFCQSTLYSLPLRYLVTECRGIHAMFKANLDYITKF